MFEQHSQFDIFICKHLSFTLCHSFRKARSFLTSTFRKIYSKRSFSSEQKPTGDLWYFILVGRSCAFSLDPVWADTWSFKPTHTHSHTLIHTHTYFELYFKCSRLLFMRHIFAIYPQKHHSSNLSLFCFVRRTERLPPEVWLVTRRSQAHAVI